jgi:electron transport complex protein RnfG
MNIARHMIISAVVLGLFAVAGTALVAWTFSSTKQRIAANERGALLAHLHEVVPESAYDNVIDKDTIEVTDPDLLGTKEPVTVYRARKQGKPVAAILTPVAPDGYAGNIRLLVAVRFDGQVMGVRVIAHKETPGLGDNIEAKRSDWILQFAGKSLGHPPLDEWQVQKDGGQFDQITSATISSRAVVKAVRKALRYYQQHREKLFSKTDNQSANA